MIAVTPTEMTISSLPGPERSITDEDLKNFHMVGLQYRNRRIGEFLKELDLVEGRNTGIPVILNAMRHNHSPDPVFSTPETRSWLSVVLPIHTAFLDNETQNQVKCQIEKAVSIAMPEPSLISSEKSSVKSSVIPSVIMTSEEELDEIEGILRQMLKRRSIRKAPAVIRRMANVVQEMRRDNQVSLEALAKGYGLTRRTVDTDVSFLKRVKIIGNAGATRNTQWKVLI